MNSEDAEYVEIEGQDEIDEALHDNQIEVINYENNQSNEDGDVTKYSVETEVGGASPGTISASPETHQIHTENGEVKILQIYKCMNCDRQFRNKGAYTNHLRIHHAKKVFTCLTCNKQFGCKKVYNNHVKLHLPQSYPCIKCSKSSKLVSYLRKHMLIHLEKRFQCYMCNKNFGAIALLRRHEATHSTLNSNVRHKCRRCGKKFALETSLIDHIAICERPNTGQLYSESDSDSDSSNANDDDKVRKCIQKIERNGVRSKIIERNTDKQLLKLKRIIERQVQIKNVDGDEN